jgi:hypothetical protein
MRVVAHQPDTNDAAACALANRLDRASSVLGNSVRFWHMLARVRKMPWAIQSYSGHVRGN